MDKASAIEVIRSSVVGVVLCIGVVLWYRWTLSRANAKLQDWAQQNGFDLLHFKRCFYSGAFWSVNRNQIVFYVDVRDRESHERSGWVRCNIWGRLEAEVKWEKT
jgi:hypothetical protein